MSDSDSVPSGSAVGTSTGTTTGSGPPPPIRVAPRLDEYPGEV